MKVLGGLMGDLGSVPDRIRALEEKGYDGAVTAEVSSDPFLPLVLAGEHSEPGDVVGHVLNIPVNHFRAVQLGSPSGGNGCRRYPALLHVGNRRRVAEGSHLLSVGESPLQVFPALGQ